ncbi:hypothetical protein M3625_24665 [Paenibacillus sp. MER 78]|uniref:hypothetical protein n=1 Tax=Paenibacillus provencensis TaxID=441151 RepID=UPI0036D2613D|nr:hypothetical protein [Paenibacillus sp. MER 78]
MKLTGLRQLHLFLTFCLNGRGFYFCAGCSSVQERVEESSYTGAAGKYCSPVAF